MAETSPTPVPAASLLLIRDDPLEVLMVRRHAGARFGSALVFPGGLVEPSDASAEWAELIEPERPAKLDQDERAHRIAALRETYEEAALLIVAEVEPGPAFCADPGTTGFGDAVRASGGRLPLGEVVPFGRWITPREAPKRFDTRFYLCQAPAGAAPICDGTETVDLEWARPRDLLARHAAGDGTLLFPTRMNLKRLAESPNSAAAIAAARARPGFTVEPRLVTRGGGTITLIPAEAGYGVTEDARPRLR